MVREDDLRATFSALHAEEAPPRAVTAADLIQRGQAVRARRRTIAVAGTGLATVGVVAVALSVLPATTPPDPAVPGPSTTTAPPQPTSPLLTTPPPSSVESPPTTVLPPTSSRPQTPPVGGSTTPPGVTSTPGRTSVTSSTTSTSPTSSSASAEFTPSTTR